VARVLGFMTNPTKLNHQAVGAFGERAVEAELLRRDWIPANVNATVKNAADFDIYAVKKGHTVHLCAHVCKAISALAFSNIHGGVPRRRSKESAISDDARPMLTALVLACTCNRLQMERGAVV
jgi:hypothetical protein